MQFKLDLRGSAFIGLLGIAVFSLCWLCAVLIDSSWTFGTNMVSDLGVSDTYARYFFNYGSIIAGVLLCAYGLLSTYYSKPVFERISYLLIGLAGAFLIGVGSFTENTGWPHNFSAYSLFILAALSAIIRMFIDLKHRDFVPAAITFLLIVSTIAVAYVETFPFLEAFAIIILLIWLTMTCLRTIIANMGTVKQLNSVQRG